MKEQAQRVSASLYSLFIGDALSMPVHWFYRASDIIRYFPPYGISQMEPAPQNHPSSIMSLHATDAGGRRRAETPASKRNEVASTNDNPSQYTGQVVGDIILKGKAPHWGGQNTHYHHGLQAGDNTLNACCARLMLRHLTKNGGYNKQVWLDDYIDFMTADPAKHPDTYAESYHRGFFANLKAGVSPELCGAVTHDTPSMGALVTVAPLAYALFKTHTLEQAKAVCCEHVQLTHPDASLLRVVGVYVSLLYCFLHIDTQIDKETDTQAGIQTGTRTNASFDVPSDPSSASVAPTGMPGDDETILEHYILAASIIPKVKLDNLLSKKAGDAAVVGGLFSTACYISDSWPSVCYLAAKYHGTPGKALLINTNLGGENAHRGAVLGSLVGLAAGQFDHALFSQLLHLDGIRQEVQQFTDRFMLG